MINKTTPQQAFWKRSCFLMSGSVSLILDAIMFGWHLSSTFHIERYFQVRNWPVTTKLLSSHLVMRLIWFSKLNKSGNIWPWPLTLLAVLWRWVIRYLFVADCTDVVCVYSAEQQRGWWQWKCCIYNKADACVMGSCCIPLWQYLIPSLTHPSIIHCMVQWVSAFGRFWV